MAKKVFVINEPKGDRTKLGNYGQIVSLVPGWIDNKDLSPALEVLVARLGREYFDGDYIVLGGHAKMNCVAFHWVLKNHSVLRQLLPNRTGWFVQTHSERIDADGNPGKWYIPS